MEEKFLPHENGAPVIDYTNSLTAGKHGPILFGRCLAHRKVGTL